VHPELHDGLLHDEAYRDADHRRLGQPDSGWGVRDHSSAVTIVRRPHNESIPMAELLLGRLRAVLRPGTRVGFLEPDFRAPLACVAYLEVAGRPELLPLRMWGCAINDLYQANRLSPAVGATLAAALETAGYRDVRASWSECRSDALMLENMRMVYDEVGDQLQTLGILTAEEIQRQQQLLKTLPAEGLPAMWRTVGVAGVDPGRGAMAC